LPALSCSSCVRWQSRKTAGITNLAVILRLRARGREPLHGAQQLDNHRVVEIPTRLEEAAQSSTPDASTAADVDEQQPPFTPRAKYGKNGKNGRRIAKKPSISASCKSPARPDDPESQSGLARALTDLALSFRSQKRLGEARPLLERAVRLHAAVWKRPPRAG